MSEPSPASMPMWSRLANMCGPRPRNSLWTRAAIGPSADLASGRASRPSSHVAACRRAAQRIAIPEPLFQFGLQPQGQERTEHMATNRLVTLVVDRSGLDDRLGRTDYAEEPSGRHPPRADPSNRSSGLRIGPKAGRGMVDRAYGMDLSAESNLQLSEHTGPRGLGTVISRTRGYRPDGAA